MPSNITPLKEWVPYNIFIGDEKCNETHMVEVIEVFKPILNYEEYYEISSFGRVVALSVKVKSRHKKGFRVKTERLLKLELTNKGYHRVKLCKDGKTKRTGVHQLIGLMFLENPLNKPAINHKNGKPLFNRLYNIEWATHSENELHSYRVLGKKHYLSGLAGKIETTNKVIDTVSKEIFISIKAAAMSVNMSTSTLNRYLHGHRKNKTNFKLFNNGTNY